MNTKTDRFRRAPTGGATAHTYFVDSTLKILNQFQKSIVKPLDEIPHGRPIWLTEINKQVPAGSQYEIESSFGSNKLILKTRTKSFKNNYDQLNRTTNEEVNAIKYQNSLQRVPKEGIASYDINLDCVKKHFPAF